MVIVLGALNAARAATLEEKAAMCAAARPENGVTPERPTPGDLGAAYQAVISICNCADYQS